MLKSKKHAAEKTKTTGKTELVSPIPAYFGGYASKLFELLVGNKVIRKRIVKFISKKLREVIMSDTSAPPAVQEDKYYLAKNLIATINKAYEQAKRAPRVRKMLINSMVRSILLKKDSQEQIRKFVDKYGRKPPTFLTISPGQACNLKCSGCYANSSADVSPKLDWNVLDKIVTEQQELWGSFFTVLSGGEPLKYESQGKTVLDLAKKHPDQFFLMYTNGTLIDKEMAHKLAEIGNISPAISVEGFEKETDERRGSGIHQKVVQAMHNLHEAGVPFGISVTATNKNAELAVSDELIDHYFKKHHALYVWVFQLMPIGRADSLELMVSPEQRVKMFRQTQHLMRERGIFIADFWNSGCVVNGCVSAGREGNGYLYIEWNGNVTPCVFNPYSPVNINDVYKRGDTLNDVLEEPFFKDIRQWQKDYILDKQPHEMGNMIVPCAIKDHYDNMQELLAKHKPKPIDKPAEQALQDSQYQEGLKRYGQQVADATDEIWRKEYLKK